MGKYAGIVTISANTQTNRTANVGVPLDPTPPPQPVAGDCTVAREGEASSAMALVTHAIPQNSWPTVEISSTRLGGGGAERGLEDRNGREAGAVLIAEMWAFWTANVSASSSSQPITAE